MSYDDIFNRIEWFRRLIEQHRQLLEPETLRNIKAMQEMVRGINPQTLQFAKQMEDQIRLMQPAIEQIRLTFRSEAFPDLSATQRFNATSDLMSGLRNWAEQMQKLDYVGDLLRFSAIPTIGYITEDFQRAIDSLEHYSIFRQSFSSQLVDYLGRLEVVESEVERRELSDELLQFLNQSLEKLRKTRISYEGFLSIILTILLFIYSQQLDYESEERIKNEIREGDERIVSELQSNEEDMINKLSEMEQKIIAQIEEQCDIDDDHEYYVVTEVVNLREGPSTEDKIIAVLQPNMTVELLLKSDEWMYIDSFDYVNLEQRKGWVHQDYLHPLDD